MKTPEQRAQIARENGAKSNGPVTPEGKTASSRNAITHGQRATALKLFVPPHSSVLANEDRHKFYAIFDDNVAKFRPADTTELAIVRQITDLQWKIERNNGIETAIFNRELLRIAPRVKPLLPELADIETCVAVQEALTGNKTIAELRKSTITTNRLIYQLQRQLRHLQTSWPAACAEPPNIVEERAANTLPDPETEIGPKRTDAVEAVNDPQPIETTEESVKTIHVSGEITDNVKNIYRHLFPNRNLELVAHELTEPIPEMPKKAA